jgi:hypothetical protein
LLHESPRGFGSVGISREFIPFFDVNGNLGISARFVRAGLGTYLARSAARIYACARALKHIRVSLGLNYSLTAPAKLPVPTKSCKRANQSSTTTRFIAGRRTVESNATTPKMQSYGGKSMP